MAKNNYFNLSNCMENFELKKWNSWRMTNLEKESWIDSFTLIFLQEFTLGFEKEENDGLKDKI